MRNILYSLFVVAVLGGVLQVESVRAQGTYRAEIGAAGATRTGLPFWLHANRDGVMDAASAGAYARLAAERVRPVAPWLTLSAGAELVARASTASALYLGEAYIAAQAGRVRAYAGRRREVIGTVDDRLSVGSLATSRNATPVPKVALATDGYVDVPFARGYVAVKGRWAHGWLGDRRFVEGAFLHQKTAYVRIGGGRLPLHLYGGLVHNAIWGGTSPEFGRLPASFSDYARTVVALNGSEDAPPGEQVYIQGDHLGIYDMGLTARLGTFSLAVYRQMVYEDKDNLEFKSPQDGLLGVSITDRRPERLVRRLVYEHLYTKWQNGPIGPGGLTRGGHGGRDNYYNHNIYQSGWTYGGRTLGSPLLAPVVPDSGVANNRVVGHHVGVAIDRGELYRNRVGLHLALVRRGTW